MALPLTPPTSLSATFVRRAIAIPSVVLATILVVGLFPLLLLVAAMVDLVTLRWRGRAVRLVLLAAGYMLVTFAIQFWGVAVWLWFGFGHRFRSPRGQNAIYSVIAWWISAMLRLLRLIGLRIRFEDITTDLSGRIVLASRHESLGDVFVPTWLGVERGKRIRLVLAAGLRLEPSLDLFAHRSPHFFVRRQGADMRGEVAMITRLADVSDSQNAFVIFPEGGLVRPRRRSRVLARIESTQPELHDRAVAMRHVLPPRVAGTAALLDAAPDADLVIVGHVGFDQLTDPMTCWRNIPLQRDVRLFATRYPRAEIPDDASEREAWLFDRWLDLDQRIDEGGGFADGGADA